MFITEHHMPPGPPPCGACNGEGQRWISKSKKAGEVELDLETCVACSGTGQRPQKK